MLLWQRTEKLKEEEEAATRQVSAIMGQKLRAELQRQLSKQREGGGEDAATPAEQQPSPSQVGLARHPPDISHDCSHDGPSGFLPSPVPLPQ